MAEYQRGGFFGDGPPKDDDKYEGISDYICDACNRDDRFMRVKALRDEAADLECPWCRGSRTVSSAEIYVSQNYHGKKY